MIAIGIDPGATLRSLREELGLTVRDAAQLVTGGAGQYLTDAASALADCEAGGPGTEWGDPPYWVRGMVALWMLRAGGWRPEGGGYRRTDGARISGNGTSSWCHWPGRSRRERPNLHERMGPGDIAGPVVRRDVLRLMMRAQEVTS